PLAGRQAVRVAERPGLDVGGRVGEPEERQLTWSARLELFRRRARRVEVEGVGCERERGAARQVDERGRRGEGPHRRAWAALGGQREAHVIPLGDLGQAGEGGARFVLHVALVGAVWPLAGGEN